MRWGGGVPKTKVAENGLKHILVWEFLESKEILEIGTCFVNTHNQPTGGTPQ